MISQILPTAKEVKPKGLFVDGYFDVEFNDLDDLRRLRAINDIVRTSMVFDTYPNPKSHEETLIGDCLTACRVLVNFAKEIGLKYKFDLAIVRRRIHDPLDRIATKHFVLITEIGSEIYVVDPTPTKGYGLGIVEKLKNSSVALIDLVISNQEDLQIVNQINELRWNTHLNIDKKITLELERNFLDKTKLLKNKDYLNAWLAEAYFSLGQYYLNTNKNLTAKYFQEAVKLDPYKLKMIGYKEYLSKDLQNSLISSQRKFKLCIEKKVENWKQELHALQVANSNVEKINDLNTFIALEKAMATGETIGIKISLNNGEYRVSDLTPRVLADNNLETIIVRSANNKVVNDNIKPLYNHELDLGNREISEWLPKITKERLANIDGKVSIMLVEKTAILWGGGENHLVKANSYSESLIIFMSNFRTLSIINKWGYANPGYC